MCQNPAYGPTQIASGRWDPPSGSSRPDTMHFHGVRSCVIEGLEKLMAIDVEVAA